MASTARRRPRQSSKEGRVLGGQRAGIINDDDNRRSATLDLSRITDVPSAGKLSLSDVDWEAISTSLAFSARESQIARLVLDDITEAVIAATLSISPKTVHAHVERLYRKLRVHSRQQLLVLIVNTYLSALATKRQRRM